ncbi:MAG: hypothetical protein E3J52_11000 [Promethearchaeota archaeon]|nr:hypothetical protein [Candidatus Lokiarchaeota archaeon]MCK4479977.1 hypothetical protein [Candidatus Lokiarchaeota archaeon]TET56990.1 MAG: hypothetical protein E3J52_11000 [Candidatus Lokiarchaeota archaeon]TKJ23702.1 MAG: hypothetical protein CEE43_03290 [Candidatus Lokiarchaeota archaeon Loki_b32]
MAMSLLPTVENNQISIQKFIDWDKFENVFYNNLYLENYKIVVKMPLVPRKEPKNEIKIKKFNLEMYTFLISYD